MNTHQKPNPCKNTMTLERKRQAPWTWRTLALSATLCTALLTLHCPTSAAALTAGSALPALTLNDQHDKPVSIPPDTRWVLFASEKSVSDMISTVLSAEPVGVLSRLHLVYVADISGMPAVITRMFALPRLRELPYPIALVRGAAEMSQVADLPRQSGSATLLRLQDGRIAEVTAVRNAAALSEALGLLSSTVAR